MAKLTPKQTISINSVLQEHLHKQDDGTWEYDAGFSDRKIADQHNVTNWHVINLRRQLYGDMKKGSGSGREYWHGSMTSRLGELEMRLARIESFMVQDWGYELNPEPNGEDA